MEESYVPPSNYSCRAITLHQTNLIAFKILAKTRSKLANSSEKTNTATNTTKTTITSSGGTVGLNMPPNTVSYTKKNKRFWSIFLLVKGWIMMLVKSQHHGMAGCTTRPIWPLVRNTGGQNTPGCPITARILLVPQISMCHTAPPGLR